MGVFLWMRGAFGQNFNFVALLLSKVFEIHGSQVSHTYFNFPVDLVVVDVVAFFE